MGDIFDTLVSGPSIRELVELGHLVPCEVIAPEAYGMLADHPRNAWASLAGGRQGFVFARTVLESQAIAASIPGAAHVDGTTPKNERDRIVEDFRQGKVTALCSVYVFTEGVDLPAAAVCMLARGCSHPSTYLQMVGRILRPSPGKEIATVIDLKGVVHKHGMPDEPRTYSLKGRAISLAEDVAPVRQCPECGAVFVPEPVCPRCGYVFPPPKAQEVQQRAMKRAGPLWRTADDKQKEKKLAELRAVARMKGYRDGWVYYRFKAIFGHGP